MTMRSASRESRMTTRAAVRSLLLCGLAVAPAARAEPYLATRQGLACSGCHANPTGGGLRNTFGNVWAQTQLAGKRLGPDDWAPWSGVLFRHLGVGGNFRTNVEWNDVPRQKTTKQQGVQETRLYLDAMVIPGRLSYYVDQRISPGDRFELESNVRLWVLPGQLYLKAGKMYLPFGWRLEDDTAFVRQLSGINMQAPDRGWEVGWEKGPWNAQLSVSNGTAGAREIDSNKQVTLRAERVGPVWRAGFSLLDNGSVAGHRKGFAVHGGANWRRFTWIGELDHFDDEGIGANGRKLLATLSEVDWNLHRGGNLKLTYEWFDPDRRVAHDAQTRTSLVYEWAPFQFVQLRAGYRFYDGIPQNDFQNRRQLLLQLHAYF